MEQEIQSPMEIVTEKHTRKATFYKSKYLTMRGYVFLLMGLVLFMVGIVLYFALGNYTLQKSLADRPLVIMPSGEIK